MLVLPDRLQGWRSVAALIDGYQIAKELGFDLREWVATEDQIYQRTGSWQHLNALELRLMLFYEYRADYFSGYTYYERDAAADKLLRALAQKLNLPDPAANPLWYTDAP